MGKVLKPLLVVAAIAVNVIPGVGQVLSAGIISAITTAGITAGLALGASALGLGPKSPEVSPASRDRLFANVNPSAYRTLAFGETAFSTDIRYQEWEGTEQEYFNQIIALASHKVTSVKEIWFDDKLAWTLAGGAQGDYAAYLSVDVRLEGTAGNTISIGTGSKWGSTRRLTGVAYIRTRMKITGNSSKKESPFAQSIPTRMTIKGEGMPVYDPRYDDTQGGVGPLRADDQSTWVFSHNGDDIGRYPSNQVLTYLLGWKIAGRLAVGRGIPPERFDLPAFATASNACDESVTLSGGGTEPRYRSDGIFSEADDPRSVINTFEATANAKLRDAGGRFAFSVLSNDLGAPVFAFDDNDVLDSFKWTPVPDITRTFNGIRGRYTDPSDAALFQLVDYPGYRETPVDGIERVLPFDLPMVQSGSQAQRLAKQQFARNQYQGKFECELGVRGWAVQLGDVVTLTFGALGWQDRLFRVIEHGIRPDGICPVVLQEENANIYLWDADEAPVVAPVQVVPYDASKAVLLQLLEGGQLEYADGTPLENLKPGEIGANVTETRNSIGFIGEGILARLSDVDWETLISNRPVELTDDRIANGLDANGFVTSGITSGIGSMPIIDLLVSGLAGQTLTQDADFAKNTIPSSYAIYDNFGSGALSYSMVQDASAPKGNSNILRVEYDGTGQPSPGIGGLVQYIYPGTENDVGLYAEATTVAFVLICKLDVGRTLNFHSNATGTGGSAKWLTSQAGTGGYETYIYVREMGVGGTRSSTGFFSISGVQADGPHTWDIAKYDQIAVSDPLTPSLEHLRDDAGNRLTDAELITLLGNSAGFTGEGVLARLNGVNTYDHIDNPESLAAVGLKTDLAETSDRAVKIRGNNVLKTGATASWNGGYFEGRTPLRAGASLQFTLFSPVSVMDVMIGIARSPGFVNTSKYLDIDFKLYRALNIFSARGPGDGTQKSSDSGDTWDAYTAGIYETWTINYHDSQIDLIDPSGDLFFTWTAAGHGIGPNETFYLKGVIYSGGAYLVEIRDISFAPYVDALAVNATRQVRVVKGLFDNFDLKEAANGTVPLRPAGLRATSVSSNALVDGTLSYVDGDPGKGLRIGAESLNATRRIYTPMWKVNPRATYRIRVRPKATTSAVAQGFYLRVCELDSDPDLLVTHIVMADGDGDPTTVVKTREITTGGVENVGLTTAYQDFEINVTPTATALWMGAMFLKWTGLNGQTMDVEVLTVDEIVPTSLEHLDPSQNTKLVEIAPSAGTTLRMYDFNGSNYNISGNSLAKYAGSGWDHSAYSREFYVDTAFLGFTLDTNNTFCGLTDNPVAGNFGNLDYSIHWSSDGNWKIYENGAQVANLGSAYTAATQFLIVYDGLSVRYYADGVLKRTTLTTAERTFYAGVAIFGATGAVSNLTFGAHTDSGAAPVQEPASVAMAIAADFEGTVELGELPKPFTVKRLKGNVDVSATATWSIQDQIGCTATVSATGVASLTALSAGTASFTVRSVRDGITLNTNVEVQRVDADPPATGGGNGTSANTSTQYGTSSSTFVPVSDEMEVETGSAAEIAFSAPLTLTAAAESPDNAAGWDVEVKWQYKLTSSGTWIDVTGGPIGETNKPIVEFESPDYFANSGSIVGTQSQTTGLVADTPYDVRLVGRRVSAPVKTIFFNGTRSAVGS